MGLISLSDHLPQHTCTDGLAFRQPAGGSSLPEGQKAVEPHSNAALAGQAAMAGLAPSARGSAGKTPAVPIAGVMH